MKVWGILVLASLFLGAAKMEILSTPLKNMHELSGV